MFCNKNNNNGTTTAILRFKREQLLYDIHNICHIEGSAAPDIAPHNRHLIQDVTQQGNIDRVNRTLELAVADARELLLSHTAHPIDRPELDNNLRQCPVFGIVLELPAGFSQTSLLVLQRQIHEYLVTAAVADWLSITAPARAQEWQLKHLNAKEAIMRTTRHRKNISRRIPHPF